MSTHYKIVCSNCKNVVAECACPTRHEKATKTVDSCTKCFEDVKLARIYPEHAKLQKVQHESQLIGEFLYEVSRKNGSTLCQYSFGEWTPVSGGIERILAEYFGIDQNKLEKEKQHMLKKQRALNERESG